MTETSSTPRGVLGKPQRGSFFLIDLPTFAKVCELGADVCASYLVLAAGTGADNRTSTWSREAINQRTGLNWRKADACLKQLEAANLIRWLDGKGTRKPRIDLPPVETRRPMQRQVDALAQKISNGFQPGTPGEKAAAALGKDAGWLAADDAGLWTFIRDRPIIKAYLPNSLVGNETGKPTGYSTVVDRIRISRDVMAFRLLADLYSLQDLAELGGVSRYDLCKEFSRENRLRTASLAVWGFNHKHMSARVKGAVALSHHAQTPTETKNAAAALFDSVSVLEDAGALEWALYMAESEEDDSNLIYPVAVVRHGKVVATELESIVGAYATRAACALLDIAEDAKAWEDHMPHGFLLLADRLARQASLVGIPRLRHRAKTGNASRWFANTTEVSGEYISLFRGLLAEHAPTLLPEVDRRLADFNDGSTSSSTFLQRDINGPSESSKHEGTALRSHFDPDGFIARSA